MTLTRRSLILAGGASFALAACGGPATLTVSAQGTAGMNPGPDGLDRPLVLQVVQMSGPGAFDGADFFSLQNPEAALGADFISTEQIVLAPGGVASTTITVNEQATLIGFIAGFRDPAGKVFRAKLAAPAGAAGVIVSINGGGLTVSPA